jgi:hypothetical protein
MLFLRILGAGGTIPTAKANIIKKPELSQIFQMQNYTPIVPN